MSLNNKTEVVLDLTYITHAVVYYFCVVICSIGFVTNTLNIVVSARKKLLKSTVGFYNILMSIFNILTLSTVGYLDLFPQSIGHTPLILRSNLNCVLISYFLRVIAQMSMWLNVMVTTDRMLCVFPMLSNKYKFIKNKCILSGIVTGLFLAICLINVSNLFFHLNPHTGMCTSHIFVILLRDLISIVTRVVIVLILQLVMNTILIYKLIKARKNLRMPVSLKKEYKFMFNIIILNGVFIVTELPFLVSSILINIYGYNQTLISHASNEAAWASFAYVCSIVFAAFFYVSLFFVNFFTNKMFGRECKKIFLGK